MKRRRIGHTQAQRKALGLPPLPEPQEVCGRCLHLRPRRETALSPDPHDPSFLCVDRAACAAREDA